MTESIHRTSRALDRRAPRAAPFAAILLAAACSSGGGGDGGGGNGGGNGGGGDVVGDEARRAVLADIGVNIIVPALQDFAARAAELDTAVAAHAADPASAPALDAARAAWRAAMTSWQYNEPLQVGPAGLSSGLDMTPGGLDWRSYIYAFPLRSPCTIEQLAANGADVTQGSAIDTTGLGALEVLLFRTEADPTCTFSADPPTAEQRAAYAAKAAARIETVANDLLDRWAPGGGDFVGEWRTAGDGSMVYSTPQDALDALSVALFYVEKDVKDDKIADPTGIGATGLDPCPDPSCPERLESRLSAHSGANIRANLQAFLDVFTGVDGGLGLNDLLRGIDRDDLADQIATEMQAALDHLQTDVPDFDAAVAAIPGNTECINASAAPEGVGPVACELHGFLKRVTDTFRGPIVAALSLATPNRAAGDND